MIPGPVIGTLSELLPHLYPRETINELFLFAGAPGQPPRNWEKAGRVQNWCLQINALEPKKSDKILSRLVERIYATPAYPNKEHLVEHVAEEITNACKEAKFELRISRRLRERRAQLVLELHKSEERTQHRQKQLNKSLGATILKLDLIISEALAVNNNQGSGRNYQLTDEEKSLHQLLHNILQNLRHLMHLIEQNPSRSAEVLPPAKLLPEMGRAFALNFAETAGKSLGYGVGPAIGFGIHSVLTQLGYNPYEAAQLLRIGI